MSYCINPKCRDRKNADEDQHCSTCGTSLLVHDRYRLIAPLRDPNLAYPTDIFEVRDWGSSIEDWGTRKVVKVLKYTQNPDLVYLFKQEARALMWLRHPRIPKAEPDAYFTVSLGSNYQLHALVMEKIEGKSLEKFLDKRQIISQYVTIEWLQQIVEALEILHSYKIVHRDIKPSNLMLKPNGQLALIDFGSVRLEDEAAMAIGSSGYAAPEQLVGAAVLQSDFFALGRTMVHLLTGRSPLDLPEDPKTGKLLWRESAPHIEKPLADLLDRLMAEKPEKRPKDTQALLKSLATIPLTPKLQ